MADNQNSNTLEKITFGNLSSILNQINRNFAVIQNSPLFKGIPGERGTQGEQGEQGNRGSSILIPNIDLFNQFFGTLYNAPSSITPDNIETLLNDETKIADLALVYGLHDSSFVYGDLLMMSNDYSVWRVTEVYENDEHHYVLEDTGVFLSVDVNLWSQINNYIREYLHDFETSFTETHELAFKNYGTLVDNSLAHPAYTESDFLDAPSNAIYYPNLLSFLPQDSSLNSAFNLENLHIDNTSVRYFHRYFSIDVNLADKEISGTSIGIKTTSVLGSLIEYQKLFLLENGTNPEDSLPYGDRIPSLVIMQNDNNSGILLGNHRKQIENEQRSLTDFAHIYRNNDGELVLNHSFSKNLTRTDDDEFYDFKISQSLVKSSKTIQTLRDFVGVNLKTQFVTSYTYSSNSDYPYQNIASNGALYLGNGVNNSNTLLDIDFKKIRFKRYANDITGFLTVDGDGYLSKDTGLVSPTSELYPYFGWFLKHPGQEETPEIFRRFNIDYALNDVRQDNFAEYISNTIPTQFDMYSLMKFLWGDIDNNSPTQNFIYNIGFQKSYKNFGNTVLKTDLSQLFEISNSELTIASKFNNTSLYSYTDAQLQAIETTYHIKGFPLEESNTYSPIKDIRLTDKFIIGGRQIPRSNYIDALKSWSSDMNSNREFTTYIKDDYTFSLKNTVNSTTVEKFDIPFSLITMGVNSYSNLHLEMLNTLMNVTYNDSEYSDIFKRCINHDYLLSSTQNIRSNYNPLLEVSQFDSALDLTYGANFRTYDGNSGVLKTKLPPSSIFLIDYFSAYLLPFANRAERKNVFITESSGRVSNDYYLSKVFKTDESLDSKVNRIDLSSETSIETQIQNDTNWSYSDETVYGNQDVSDHYLLTMKHFKFIIKLFDKFKNYIQNFVTNTAITNEDREFLVPEGTIISWYPTTKKTITSSTGQAKPRILKDRYTIDDEIELPKGWVPCVSGFILETTEALQNTGIGDVRLLGINAVGTLREFDIEPVTFCELFFGMDTQLTYDKISTLVNTYTVPDLTNKFIMGHRPHHFVRKNRNADDATTTWIKDYKPSFIDVQRLLQRVGWTRTKPNDNYNKIYDIIDDFADSWEGDIYGTNNNYYMGLIRGIDKWYWEGYQNPRASYMNGLPKLKDEILRKYGNVEHSSYYYCGNPEGPNDSNIADRVNNINSILNSKYQDRIQLLLNHFNYYDMMQSSVMGVFHNHGEFGLYKRYYNRDFTSTSDSDDFLNNPSEKTKHLRISHGSSYEFNPDDRGSYASSRCIESVRNYNSTCFTDSWNNGNTVGWNNPVYQSASQYLSDNMGRESRINYTSSIETQSMITIPSIELMQLYKTPKRVSKDNYLYFVIDYSLFVEALNKTHNTYSENVNLSSVDSNNPNKIPDDNVLNSQNLKYIALMLERPDNISNDTDIEKGYTTLSPTSQSYYDITN